MEYKIIISITYKYNTEQRYIKKMSRLCISLYKNNKITKITNLHLLVATYHRIVIYLSFEIQWFFLFLNIFFSTAYTCLKFLSLIFQIAPVLFGIFRSGLFCSSTLKGIILISDHTDLRKAAELNYIFELKDTCVHSVNHNFLRNFSTTLTFVKLT